MPIITEPREEFLFRGKNGLETCIILSEDYASMFPRGKLMERDRVKEILKKLNEANVPYAIIGGMAYAHYCPPRTTQDLDLIVLSEDAGRVRGLFSNYYLRGTRIVGIYDYHGTRFDVLPASLGLQRSVVSNAVDSQIDELPVKIARLQDLIMLKLLAAPNRPEMLKRMQDQTDVVGLIEYNHEQLTPEDITYICEMLLQQVYTLNTQNKTHEMIQWLNETLDELGLSDLKYSQPNQN
jgi:hypothetical protein